MSFWLIVLCIRIKYPFISLLLNLKFESHLVSYWYCMPAYFLRLIEVLLSILTLKAGEPVFKAEISCRPQIDGFYFLIFIQLSVCLLIGELALFIFKVIIKRHLLITVIVLLNTDCVYALSGI